jgi:HAD superfamily hydrolase (TIGR01490 family)
MAKKLAAFDIDGTIASSTVVHPLLYIALRLAWANPFWWIKTTICAIWWLWLERVRHDRGGLNISFYRSYAGWNVARVKELGQLWEREVFTQKIFAQAADEMTRLRSDGYQLVFVTGGLDFLFESFAKAWGAELIAASLEEQDGKFTGRLVGGPLAGQKKAELLLEYARSQGISLKDCYAYGDSSGDAPMMAICGTAYAVNPSRGLRKMAAERGWRVLKFSHKNDKVPI